MSSNTQPSSTPPPPSLPQDEQIQGETQKEAQKELSKLLNGLQHDPALNGVFSMGEDGVMRSLTADREVVDAVGLRPELIKAFFDRWPYDAEREVVYRGVDGTKVPREQWFHPDKNLLPEPYIPPEDKRNPSPEQLEENRRWLEERAKIQGCEPRVQSDHDFRI